MISSTSVRDGPDSEAFPMIAVEPSSCRSGLADAGPVVAAAIAREANAEIVDRTRSTRAARPIRRATATAFPGLAAIEFDAAHEGRIRRSRRSWLSGGCPSERPR